MLSTFYFKKPCSSIKILIYTTTKFKYANLQTYGNIISILLLREERLMKYCVKCGSQNADSSKFCTECGAALAVSETSENNYNHETDIIDTTYSYGDNTSSNENTSHSESTYSEDKDKYSYTYNANSNSHTGYSSVHPGIIPRSIALSIILSIVTCGIYQLYWMFKMNDEVNILSSEPAATSGGIVILLHLVTCGIYGIYWSYKMGERCDRIKGSANGSSDILYLILTLLGFGIVTMCLIQDSINKAV